MRRRGDLGAKKNVELLKNLRLDPPRALCDGDTYPEAKAGRRLRSSRLRRSGGSTPTGLDQRHT